VATLCSRTSLSSSSGGACCHAGVRRISSMMELLSTSFQPFLMSLQSGTSFRFPAQRDRFGICRPLGGGFSLHSLSKDSSFSVSSLALKLKPKTGRRGVLELSRTVSAAAAVTARSPETDLFLADPSITWNSLGLSQELTKALLQIDLQQPSLIQCCRVHLEAPWIIERPVCDSLMLFKEDQNVSPSVPKPFARIQVKNSEFPSNPFFSLVCFAGSLNPFDFVNRRCDSSSRDRQWKNTCLLSSSYSQASAVTKCCK
jgi:hypothetical protein